MSQPREEAPSSRDSSPQGPRPSIWRDARAALALLFGTPLGFFILCALGFVATYFFQQGPSVQRLAFLSSRQSGGLHVVLAIQPVLWGVHGFILWSEFRSHRLVWPGTRRERIAVLLCASAALVMITLPFVAQLRIWRVDPSLIALSTVPRVATRTGVLGVSGIGIAVGALHTLSLFCLHVQLLHLLPASPSQGKEPEGGGLDDEVSRYLQLRAQLRLLLGLAALTIGTAMLSVGILRNLLNDAFPSRPELFPAAPVVGYGVYFTALIASSYFPVRKTLADVGEALAERLVRQSLGANAPWKARAEERQAAHAYLGLQMSAFQELQQGIAVLAPLLGGLSSLLLGPDA